MAGVVPFEVLSAEAAVGHGELAIALGAEFGVVEPAGLDDEPKLAWQCAHEAAGLLLKLLIARTREIEDQLASVRAQLN